MKSNKHNKGNNHKHTVKVSKWKGGRLQTERHEFDELEDAIKSAKFFTGRVKIYDKHKELVQDERREEEHEHEHEHHHEHYA